MRKLKEEKKNQKKSSEQQITKMKKMIKALKSENEEVKKIKGCLTSTWKKIFGDICLYNNTIQKDSETKQEKMKKIQQLDSESEK